VDKLDLGEYVPKFRAQRRGRIGGCERDLGAVAWLKQKPRMVMKSFLMMWLKGRVADIVEGVPSVPTWSGAG
jgi:hypothetical protein